MAHPHAIVEASPLENIATEAVVETAAHVAASGMPLPAGLRAADQEAGSRRDAATLRRLAAEIQRGRSLHDCVASAKRLPPYVAGLIRAAERTGDMGVTLASWSANRRSARQ